MSKINKFNLGDSVLVLRRDAYYVPFKPWREGCVTAIGEGVVRVRTKGIWRPVRWINLEHPEWNVVKSE